MPSNAKPSLPSGVENAGYARGVKTAFERFAARPLDSYLSLLVLISLTIFLMGVVDIGSLHSGWAEAAALMVTALVGGVLILAVHTSGGRARLSIIVVAITLGASVLTAISGFSPRFGLLWLLLVVAAPIVVMRRLLQHDRVTNETILGAICAYLLIGLAYTFLFIGIDQAGSTLFFGNEEPTTAFMYFSLVTMTTLGYGDLAPATEVARIVSASEAVVGQVFLVVLVARLVALYGGGWRREPRRRRRGRRDTPDETDAPGNRP